MTKSGIVMDSNTLTVGIKEFSPKLHRRLEQLTGYTAQRSQDWMRQHAPWTDRTANARQGLFSRDTSVPNKYRVTMYHTVPYGIFLEVRWDGRYQVIMPTVKRFGAQYMTQLKKLLAKL